MKRGSLTGFTWAFGYLVMSYIALVAFIAAAIKADDTVVQVIAWGLACQQFARMLKADLDAERRR